MTEKIDPRILSEEQLKAIATRESVATDGPWYAEPANRKRGDRRMAVLMHPQSDDCYIHADFSDLEDANFAAHARTDIPALFGMVRALQEQIAALTDPKTAPYRAALALYDCRYYDIEDTMRAMEYHVNEQIGQGAETKLEKAIQAVYVHWFFTPGKSDEEYIADIRKLLANPPKEDEPNE